MTSSSFTLLLRLAAVALAPMAATAASAETFTLTLPAGKASGIMSSGEIDPTTCKTVDTVNGRIVVLKGPAHGRTTSTLHEVPFHSIAGRSPCEGKLYLANILVYQPQPGFKGHDSVVVQRTFWINHMEQLDSSTIELEIR